MIKSRNWQIPLIHIAIWMVIAASIFFLFPFDQREYGFFIIKSLIGLALYAAVFYLNYLWLIQSFFFKRKFFVFVVINIVLVLVIMLVKTPWIDRLFMGPMPIPVKGFGGGPPPNEPLRGITGLFVVKDWISNIIPVFMALIVAFIQRWIGDEKRQSQIQNEQLQSEIHLLRYQLQPHFFFNALNTIYALTEVDPKQAQVTIHGFSKLMRYMLYESDKPTVSLSDEMDFIENYIQLMRLRLPATTEVVTNFPEVAKRNGMVIPMVFLPLVENAFKHGVSASQASTIVFELEIMTNSIVFKSSNSNHSVSDEQGSGIGLENLRKRLELSYPNSFSFDTVVTHGVFRTHLIIPKHGQ